LACARPFSFGPGAHPCPDRPSHRWAGAVDASVPSEGRGEAIGPDIRRASAFLPRTHGFCAIHLRTPVEILDDLRISAGAYRWGPEIRPAGLRRYVPAPRVAGVRRNRRRPSRKPSPIRIRCRSPRRRGPRTSHRPPADRSMAAARSSAPGSAHGASSP